MSTVFNKGEVCLAGSRLFVHNSIKEEFLVRLKAVIAKIRVGDPLNDATQLGALASQAQYNKVSSYLDLAVREGATPVAGGQLAAVKGLEKGFFVQPTIYDNVAPNMRIAQEEIFGPVSVVIGWSDEAEVLRHANNSTYGLAGGIWTRDLAQAHRIARALQTGTVWINRYYNFHVGMSLGGYKQSGFGRELSEEIIDAYTVTKSVVVGLADNPIGLFA
jgi:aldehyde dehydrogenase